MSTSSPQSTEASRRDFLKTSTAVAGAALATHLAAPHVHAAGGDLLRVGLIGCGNRGTGAARGGNTDRRINTTGHVLEWLALAMSTEELKQPWVENAVNRLSLMILGSQGSALDAGSLYHSTHGLHLYYARVFGKREGHSSTPLVPLPPKD